MKLILLYDITHLGGTNLTPGKIYDGELILTFNTGSNTMESSNTSYIIECDDGGFRTFMAEYFMTIEEWREKQLDKIL